MNRILIIGCGLIGSSVLRTVYKKKLARKIAKGCKESLELLVQHNLRLVIKTAHRYEGCGVDFMDLVDLDGFQGLDVRSLRHGISRDFPGVLTD